MKRMRVLIVDDEVSIVSSLTGVLQDDGIQVIGSGSGKEALEKVRTASLDVVLLDIWMPGMDGIETLTKLKEGHPDLPVIMMSGHGTIETAVKATRLGAYDYLEKPLSIDKVLLTVRHAVEASRLRRENLSLREKAELKPVLVGDSLAIRETRRVVSQVAPTEGWVLITGENGTGKEVVARRIHALSSRSEGPFVEVNCAAIPEELIESELFGHERGAFTGAVKRRLGKFELADGGTLFLDEIGDMSLKTQAKVLRALEQQAITRVGGESVIPINIRVIAASNKDLQAAIKKGEFRDDLFYRIQVVPIALPPLRDRIEDIPLLIKYFLRVFARLMGRQPIKITPEAISVLKSYSWPGNVRELKNLVERLVILVQAAPIKPEDIPPPVCRHHAPSQTVDAQGLRDAKDHFEKEHITQVLQECNGNISQAARVLKIQRTYLHRRIKQLNIPVSNRARDKR